MRLRVCRGELIFALAVSSQADKSCAIPSLYVLVRNAAEHELLCVLVEVNPTRKVNLRRALGGRPPRPRAPAPGLGSQVAGTEGFAPCAPSGKQTAAAGRRIPNTRSSSGVRLPSTQQ